MKNFKIAELVGEVGVAIIGHLLVILNRALPQFVVGGVGGYAAQIASAFGGVVVAIDVHDDKLAAIEQQCAALTLNAVR